MQHPLLFADKFMDLIAGQKTELNHEDIVFLNELNIGKYITDGRLSKKYFAKKEPVVEDTAFIVKYLHEVVDTTSIANFIYFVIDYYVAATRAGVTLKNTQKIVGLVLSKVKN